MRIDREPQLGDGPDYHADHAFWVARQREANVAKTMAEIISAALEHSPALDCVSCDGAERAEAALSAAGYGLVADAQARAYDKGYGHGRHDGTYHPPFSGNPRPQKSRRNPYRKASDDGQ